MRKTTMHSSHKQGPNKSEKEAMAAMTRRFSKDMEEIEVEEQEAKGQTNGGDEPKHWKSHSRVSEHVTGKFVEENYEDHSPLNIHHGVVTQEAADGLTLINMRM